MSRKMGDRTPGGKIRLLISARDVGPAHHLAVVARAAAHHPDINIHVVAEPPAARIFAAAGIPAETVAAADRDWLETSNRLLAHTRPDAVLVGLSGLGRGIDEAILATARTPHSYALQDYWGDINPGWGTYARTFFVLDNEAARLTHRRINVRTVVVGNLRYAVPAASFNPVAFRLSARRSYKIEPEALVVGFYGQGHLDVPGYWRTVEVFTSAIAKAHPEAIVLFRPHPLEHGRHRDRTLSILTRGRGQIVLDESLSVEESVSAVDILCTCYSSCGQVHNYLSCIAPAPLGVVVYMMFDDELGTWFRDYTHLESVPMIEYGLAPSTADDLVSMLDIAARESKRQDQWALVRRSLKVGENSARMLLDVIVSDVAAEAGTAASGYESIANDR